MKKLLFVGVLLGMSCLGYGKDIAKVVITEQEKTQMLNEADDFIDEIPEGQPDRQADAILHALQGSGAELEAVRQSRNGMPTYSADVVVKDISPIDGPARGVPLRLYRAKSAEGKTLPLLVYFHGGGWCFGGLNSCASYCDALASKGDVAVLAVEYSLAPENPFPRGLSDCIAAVEYAFGNAAELGVSPEMINVGGDSAGGNLALAAAMYFAENKPDDKIKSLVLYYPVVDIANENEGSWREYSRGYGLDRRLMDAFVKGYDDNGKAQETIGNISKDVLKSPAKASDELIKKLPPMLMISAGRDILVDQGKVFAAKVKDAGNTIERVEFPGAIHLFITVPGQTTAFEKAVAITDGFLGE